MTPPPTLDVLGLGNALVDILAKTTDDFLANQQKLYGMQRGAMNLINEQRAVELYALMGPGVEMSGGSAGNTIAHLAALGGRGGYIGKVADDQLGQVFRHDLKSMGITYTTVPLMFGPQTGRCMILVSPDGTRTMNTFLGAGAELRPEDLDQDLISSAAITYLEGYLFDAPHNKQAFFLAGSMAHGAGRRVALTLSDLFCVKRHHSDFVRLIDQHIDILFANETEVKALAQTDDLNAACAYLKGKCDIAVVTLGERGSLILAEGNIIEIKPVTPSQVVDTTGAGDAYAAGFLYALTRGQSLSACGDLASKTASKVLSYMGPRPLSNAA